MENSDFLPLLELDITHGDKSVDLDLDMTIQSEVTFPQHGEKRKRRVSSDFDSDDTIVAEEPGKNLILKCLNRVCYCFF